MAKRLTLIFCLISLVFGSVQVNAATLQGVDVRQIYMYTDVMNLYINMNDADGQPIETPAKTEIYASIDNAKMGVRDIRRFSESGEGMSYIFLIDISGSLNYSQFSQVKTATKKWAESMNEKDRMALITFGNEVKLVQDFTNDATSLVNTIDGISNNDGRTNLYGGLDEAMNLISRNDSELPKRKAVFLLSDGKNDYDGGISEDDTLKRAQEELVPIYGLWVPGRGSNNGEAFMNTLRDYTNGIIYNISTHSVESVYSSLQEDFSKSFIVSLSYPAGKTDGQLHNIKISVRCDGKEVSDNISCILKKPTGASVNLPIAETSAGDKEGGNFMSSVLIIAFAAILLILIAIIIIVVAFLNRSKKKSVSYISNSAPVYSAESANIPKSEPITAATAPASEVSRPSGPSVKFTLTEIGGNDVKSATVSRSIVIGRSPECGIVIHDPQISGQHCSISYEQSTLYIEDLGSTNGTLVNGLPLNGRNRLVSGDLVMIGDREYRISF